MVTFVCEHVTPTEAAALLATSASLSSSTNDDTAQIELQTQLKSSTMSTRQRKQPSETTASKSAEEDDIGALIYRESQLRKKETAAAATSSQMNWEDSSTVARENDEHVAPSEAAALATSASWSSVSAGSIIQNGTAENNPELQTQLFNGHSSTDQEQHPSHDGREKKRDLQVVDSKNSSKQMKEKRQKLDTFLVDLSDVPQQPPIPKSAGRIKEGASKYTGVYFNQTKKKWIARVNIGGKDRHIGCYEDEEEAAVDYARAFSKYRGQEALHKARERKSSASEPGLVIDLSDVPQQQPILKAAGRVNKGTSKYTGVHFNQAINKWLAQIHIDGKQRHIGRYESEEEAASDYARAVLKYRGQEALAKERKRKSSASEPGLVIDLSGIPQQTPIPKSVGRIKEGASQYAGVSYVKRANKWIAHIRIDGKTRYIGCYESEEEAAVDYARAVLKYRGQEALAKKRKRKSSASEPGLVIDLSDVPQQQPILILKAAGRVNKGTSKYTGVHFNQAINKWLAQIHIDGKQRHIGRYESEEEAASDYARAVLKYRGQEALAKERKRKSSASEPGLVIDLSDVPQQQPILKSAGRVNKGTSKYTGVSFNQAINKWLAHIYIDGKQRHIGQYESEEEAASDYARAVFKYKVMANFQQLPNPKSAGRTNE